jgi:phenylalanyl-tRNA synthetase alpha chain
VSFSLQEWKPRIEACQNLADLDSLRVRLVGKSGLITDMLKGLAQLDAEARKARGAEVNAIKTTIQELLEKQKDSLAEAALSARLQTEGWDMTLPSRQATLGRLHPLTQVFEDVSRYFQHLDFTIVQGPDIEDEEHNFNALNIPVHHPARQSHDTFYLQGGSRLLRTHTSPVQIRTMRQQPPPLRILVPGRTYRCDHDATHTPMFHQFEGLVIDRDIHMGHLKGCLGDFCRVFFGIDDLPVRFRPSFFPFTEPSAEVDIGCSREGGILKIGPGADWLEILGCGMVHPKVLQNCGIDPDVYQGFAFGMGVERLTMLKYGIADIRDFYACDARWLQHYGMHPLGGAR